MVREGRIDISPESLSKMLAYGFGLWLLKDGGIIKTLTRMVKTKKEPFIEVHWLFERNK